MHTVHRRILGALAALATLLIPTSLAAQWTGEWTSARPDGHAPIGVMGDHTHSAGEFMLSYRFMRMSMEGNRNGTDAVSTDDVLGAFMVAPLEMTMDMHMIGGMFAPSDRVTLMGMLPFVSTSMDHRTRMGGEFTTESSGIGDLKLGGLIALKTRGEPIVHLNAAVSIPTGAIDATDVTPASAPNAAQLPYPMQIGSGTWDLEPGVTVLGQGHLGSWGAQAKGTFRLGENDRGWTAGNVIEGTAWLALKLSDRFSASVRGAFRSWGDVDGADPAFTNPMMVPTARADLRAGKRFDLPLGVNFSFPAGTLGGHRILVEYGLPVWQDLDGPQLETSGVLTIGWQKSFEARGGGH